MPELPEVEAARRAVEEHCVGKKINKCTVADDSKVVDGVSPKDFEAALAGKTIVAAHRKGKNMWLELDSPPFPTFQFGMAGAVYIKGVAVTKYKRSAVKDTDEWPSKYSKLFVQLDDGLEFSFTDKRRFAKVRLIDNPISAPPISELGPDALKEPMTEDEFYSALCKKKIGIKALLLDQSFISGIGNWMADEVLYQARIHPQQAALSMSKDSCATLLKSINEVIEKAIHVGADSSQFPSDWIFHSREKKPGKAFVDGKKIAFINAGGRTTAYVPELQKLPGDQAVKESRKLSKGASSGNGDESGNDEELVPPNPKKDKKTSRARQHSTKKRANGSSDDSEEDESGNVSSKRPAKRKAKENDKARRQTRGRTKVEQIDDEASNESGSEDGEEEPPDVKNRTPSKKRAAPKQKGRPKQKAK
ncbi:formamidopyrimidine-DNA glycosylase isoform X1 [Andrographis paniculata]|uniref:formamidopyrimidine-DNA glycosylase isoform X1 n=1 Tax=Andrographis paniculata TaxID=175694 RepID=UPI0021E7C997|nr:formamidopyrimidine-DNA glycosylase isoform X1 [Andrographis paniculata]